MSKTAYLRNGEEVELHEELSDNRFIIERMLTYIDEYGDESLEPCGVLEVVKVVFLTPPIQRKDKEVIRLDEELKAKRVELSSLERKFRSLNLKLTHKEKYKTDLSRHMINRSELLEADSITVFVKFKPLTFTETNTKKNIVLDYRLSVNDGKFSAWACRLDYNDRESFEKINLKYGILINATEDEILAIGKQIVIDAENDGKITKWDLDRTDLLPDEYLTEELKQKRADLFKKQKENKIESAMNEIEKKQKELDELKSNIES